MPPTEYQIFRFNPEPPPMEKNISLPRSAVADPVALAFEQLSEFLNQLDQEGWTVLQVLLLPVGITLAPVSGPQRHDHLTGLNIPGGPQLLAGGMSVVFGVLAAREEEKKGDG